ncbi:phenylalanine--tRNA ligase subunit beta [Allostreptomyces psammosilenae]|uniref:Phenylalanine--tRNA ligase beta subunit n=1 Tax=Allostreptomyces psammosilenae TaxID=1892865 RepID=A0A852ZRX3_9ACTN|nr:phenylalanine--tRNA ligase subunit beta [Allostreptomyces psammosilenae]NYI04030.1 phenylalanyl-tRNA synthetase beta chain [Allostreptomyces psammosilenae]
MRVPLSWLREYVDLPAGVTGREVADRLLAIGHEVEAVEQLGAGLKGPLVVGQVLAIEELSGFKKPIRHCQVDVGDANGTGEPQSIVCGATNFAVGDQVVVVLPGGVLPGDFQIAARKTYGRMSEGMICSARELGMSDEHDGIIVLPPGQQVGADAIELLGLVDEVLDIAVTPDRGYCLSLRGIAREAATAYGVALRDPALLDVPAGTGPGPAVNVEDTAGCDRFVARAVTGLNPEARTPLWMQRRIQMAGMRPINLPVDVTNYVMLELGQPLHAYDRGQLAGPITVRRATAGETLRTLDDVERTLDPRDLVIADDRGAIALAGVMGGASSEINHTPGGAVGPTTDVVIEAAHFDAMTIARAARRHRLSSEAARRFERGVDPRAAGVAAQRAVDLLCMLGGGTAEPGVTDVDATTPPTPVVIPADHPDRVAGTSYGRDTVVRRLQDVGCGVTGADELTVTPPTWRPDLVGPNDLAEEVIRLEGYHLLPSTMPTLPPGLGLTARQRLVRTVGRTLAGDGWIEVQCYPFVGDAAWDAFGLDADDPRRTAVRLSNPISDEEPLLRTTLLPGLLATLRRNEGRGNSDVALYETGLVFHPRPGGGRIERLPVDRRPSDEELAALDAALPEQPRHVAGVLAGARERAGWWGEGRPAGWADAVRAAQLVADAARARVTVRQAEYAPWHPGRCAAFVLVGEDGAERVVGHAGELHPRVVTALGLPARTAAFELDLDALAGASGGPVQAPRVSTFPVATQDVALVVPEATPAAEVAGALREGAGELLESLRLFDVYTGQQIGEGYKSLAYALRFRAPDRTLTVEETTAARDAAVALAGERTGAVLRGA